MMQPTSNSLGRSAIIASAILIGMLAFDLMPWPRAARDAKGAGATIDLVRKTVKTRGLSAAAREEQTAGYYQELLDGATTVVAKTPQGMNQFVGGRQLDMGAPQLEELGANVVAVNDRRHDFLIYRSRPNLDILDPRFNNVRTVTNSQGFSDREYAFERAPNTRRIVVLGDSMARALGVAPGGGFEALLEDYMNQHDATEAVRRFELINMGVSGYRLTQVVDLALNEGPRYKPDAYVLVVSWLTVARKWGLHLAQLVEEGIDPKYEFLRQVAREAGLKKGDSAATSEARLAPFMLPALQWALREINGRAKADGATMAVILMPHLKGIGSYENDFGPVRKLLKDEGIPSVDLLDAFDTADIAALDVGDGLHPNTAGHRMLFELLYRRMSASPELSAVFRGRLDAASKTQN